MYYHQLVKPGKARYRSAKGRADKRQVAKDIIKAIKKLEPPGRFLVPDSLHQTAWYEATYDGAMMKTCQALRENIVPARHVFVTNVTVMNNKLRVGYSKEEKINSKNIDLHAKNPSMCIEEMSCTKLKLNLDDNPSTSSISSTSAFNDHEKKSFQSEKKHDIDVIGNSIKAAEVQKSSVLSAMPPIDSSSRSSSWNSSNKNALTKTSLDILLRAAQIKAAQRYCSSYVPNYKPDKINENAYLTVLSLGNTSCNSIIKKGLKEPKEGLASSKYNSINVGAASTWDMTSDVKNSSKSVSSKCE